MGNEKRVRITDTLIKRMDAPPSDQHIEWDSEVPGFGVRITAAGAISFVLDYRMHGRKRRYTIGRYPDLNASAARDEATTLRGEIRKGNDPLEGRKKDRDALTLNALSVEYQETGDFKKCSESHKKNCILRLERKILPKLGRRPLKAITKNDIETLHEEYTDRPYEGNRIRALLSVMFEYAIERKYVTENPVTGVKPYHEDKREKWLTLDQMAAFATALDGMENQNAANAIRLLILTGSRRGEPLKAKWEDFDLDRATWLKPAHTVKQKKQEHVPLNSETVLLLKGMKEAAGGDTATGPLFPGRKGKDTHRVNIRIQWLHACKAAGLVAHVTNGGKKITDYRPSVRMHDLRHSYASYLVSAGVSLPVVGSLLGHRPGSKETSRYGHVQADAARAATNRLPGLINFATKAPLI